MKPFSGYIGGKSVGCPGSGFFKDSHGGKNDKGEK